MDDKKIIIIGGGMAGMALALFLKKAGLTATIFEARSYEKQIGTALTIAPNGMNVMNELGLAEAIISGGNVITAYEFKNDRGNHIATIQTGPIVKYGQPSVLIERGILLDILNGAVSAQEIEVNYNKKLSGIKENTNGIDAFFEDGSTVTGTLLIGADGIYSTTRRLIFPNGKQPNYVGFYGTGGLVNSGSLPKHEKLTKNDISLVYGANGFFGYGFDKRDELLWWTSLEIPENQVRQFIATTTDEQLRKKLLETFRDYNYPVKELISATPKFTQTASYELADILTWNKGRVVLVGDAAHALSTTTGQGASMAFEDAMYLSKLLRDYSPEHYSRIFADFEEHRKPRLTKFREGAKRGNSDKKITSPVKLFIRQKLMAFFISLFAEKGLKWQYGYRIDWNSKN